MKFICLCACVLTCSCSISIEEESYGWGYRQYIGGVYEAVVCYIQDKDHMIELRINPKYYKLDDYDVACATWIYDEGQGLEYCKTEIGGEIVDYYHTYEKAEVDYRVGVLDLQCYVGVVYDSKDYEQKERVKRIEVFRSFEDREQTMFIMTVDNIEVHVYADSSWE